MHDCKCGGNRLEKAIALYNVSDIPEAIRNFTISLQSEGMINDRRAGYDYEELKGFAVNWGTDREILNLAFRKIALDVIKTMTCEEIKQAIEMFVSQLAIRKKAVSEAIEDSINNQMVAGCVNPLIPTNLEQELTRINRKLKKIPIISKWNLKKALIMQKLITTVEILELKKLYSIEGNHHEIISHVKELLDETQL